ncbi:hypothetical protein CHS0354_012799 [Potamilus streckersoni]|uniref:Uncharacterized protein n=1 Tax=Potamilus streckersoni TaxID=2493646 RepID=A0AAE0SVY8_9BIVA|nr:hypothetical protein CHS0354_012799 [Potamilus streckersoni]
MVGENVTIDWFYSRQWMHRTVRIIHPREGAMMVLQQFNKSTIRSDFHNRLLYRGNSPKSYMSFTLLDLRMSDAGIYTIETQHGNRIPGGKTLIVEDITITSSGDAANINTSTTDIPHYTRSDTAYDQHRTVIKGVPFYVVIPMVVVTLASIVCVMWIHHKRNTRLETDRPHTMEEFDADLYLTPIGCERHLPLSLMNDGHVAVANTIQFDSSMLLVHTIQTVSMDGYEIVDVSSHDSYESIFNNDETTSLHAPDNFGYLTVLGVLETSV